VEDAAARVAMRGRDKNAQGACRMQSLRRPYFKAIVRCGISRTGNTS
jgi:hypothetical protein